MNKMYVIEGNPTPLARPRFNTASLHIYDSQKMEKIHAQLDIENQHGDNPLYKGPLCLYATFYMPIPKSLSPKKRLALDGTFHHGRPDLDNLLKLINDISNTVLFNDDAQIAIISGRKVYSLKPCTTFTILELNHEHDLNNPKETPKETTQKRASSTTKS
jgi:Holliday junction resolvase RusA-like endonuclease